MRAITIKFLLYYSSNIKIKTFVKCMITDLVLKSDLGILEKFNAILEIYKKEPQNCNITYGSSGELFKSNLFPGLIFDLDDKTFNYYKEIVQQKSDTSKRLLASLILGFILTALCIFELNLINIFLDLKILFFTSSAIALYFVLITMSVYKISIK